MRISNIKEFLGGADNVYARELLRGEQIIYDGIIQDSDGNPIDITSYQLSAVAQFYRGNVTITGGRSGETATITNFAPFDPAKADVPLTVTKANDPSTGRFTVLIPFRFSYCNRDS